MTAQQREDVEVTRKKMLEAELAEAQVMHKLPHEDAKEDDEQKDEEREESDED